VMLLSGVESWVGLFDAVLFVYLGYGFRSSGFLIMIRMMKPDRPRDRDLQ